MLQAIYRWPALTHPWIGRCPGESSVPVNQGDEPFDLVQPRTTGGGETEVELFLFFGFLQRFTSAFTFRALHSQILGWATSVTHAMTSRPMGESRR
jgi:hypothetical protein